MTVLEKIRMSSKPSSKRKDDVAEFVPKSLKAVKKTISISSSATTKKGTTFFERLDSNKENSIILEI